MLGPLTLSLPLAVVLCFALVLSRRQRLVASWAAHPGLAVRDALTLRARGLGIVAGVLAVVAARFALGPGRTIVAAPAIFGTCVLVALAWAEAATWRRATHPGVAALESRTAHRYLPRSLLTATALVLAGLAPLLLWCRGHQGTDGRSWSWTSPDGLEGHSGSPFPGEFYATPLVIALSVAAVVALTGLVLAIRRPRDGSDPVVVAVDDDSRRHSCEAMVAAFAAASCGSAAIILTLSASAIEFLTDPQRVWSTNPARWGTWLGLGSSVLVVMTAWAVAVLLVPGSARKVEA